MANRDRKKRIEYLAAARSRHYQEHIAAQSGTCAHGIRLSIDHETEKVRGASDGK